MQNELNVAASGGFRLLWKTVAGKRGTKGGGFGKLLNPSIGLAGPLSLNADETVAVMEKSPQSENHYEYRVVETIRTSTAQADIYKAVQEGFVPVAMVGGPSVANFIPLVPVVANVIVILEKPVSRSSS